MPKPTPSTCPICAGPSTDQVNVGSCWYTTCYACERIYVTHWGRRTPSIELSLSAEVPAWADERV